MFLAQPSGQRLFKSPPPPRRDPQPLLSELMAKLMTAECDDRHTDSIKVRAEGVRGGVSSQRKEMKWNKSSSIRLESHLLLKKKTKNTPKLNYNVQQMGEHYSNTPVSVI